MSKMSQSAIKPHYFHLLWDEDLDDLREVLECIRDRHSEVVSHWYQLYLSHFGDDRSLSESEFGEIFKAALLRNQEALLRRDLDDYAANVLATGKQLAERHVALEEVIAAIELFEEAAQTVQSRYPQLSTAVCRKLHKLSSIQIILLVGVYARLQSASAGIRIHALELEARYLPAQERSRFHGLVGHSPVMRELYGRIEAAGHDDGPLLIVGERGSGKELLARAIHECGARRDKPFAALRCGVLPGYLIEGELFGYQSEAHNGNQAVYLGLYRTPEGGTLFLDELTEIPLHAQVKLLRAIEAAESGRAAAKVRIIAATHRDPDEAARLGQFDQGLKHRFRSVLRVPPLREHVADVPLLVEYCIDLLNKRMARRPAVIGVDDAALEALLRCEWPGNVQELFNALETAFANARSPIVGLADLPAALSGRSDKTKALPTISFETFADAERGVLKRALELTGGNKVRAAKLLKISRKKLYSGIAKYGLSATNR